MSSLSAQSLNPAKSATPGSYSMGIDGDLDSKAATSRVQNMPSGTDCIGANSLSSGKDVSKFEFSRADYKSSTKKLKGASAQQMFMHVKKYLKQK